MSILSPIIYDLHGSLQQRKQEFQKSGLQRKSLDNAAWAKTLSGRTPELPEAGDLEADAREHLQF